MNATNVLLTALALGAFDQTLQPEPVQAVTHHKERVKRVVTKKQRTGRGKPAKGYDPETKTWSKP